eukprot:scpid66916/ scgid34124/ 
MMTTQRRPVSLPCDGGLLQSSISSDSWAEMDLQMREQPQAAAKAGCLKVRNGSDSDSTVAQKKKSVSFPLNTIFSAAVKDHRENEINTIVNLLVPEPYTSQTLRQPSVQASAAIRHEVKVRLDLLHINQVSAKGFSALLLCARAGHFDAVRSLVMAGASVSILAPGGWSIFHAATMAGRADMMGWLLANCGLSYAEIYKRVFAVQKELFYVLGQSKMSEMKNMVDASVQYLSGNLRTDSQ